MALGALHVRTTLPAASIDVARDVGAVGNEIGVAVAVPVTFAANAVTADTRK
jgi:hypothetical protein